MDATIGAASRLIGTVLKQLSAELVEAYVASAELGLNSTKIKEDLLLTQGLLHEAQRSGVIDNPGLEGLLPMLSAKADEAEDALDELHYFIIQDQLDGTKYAVPDLGDGFSGHARHGRHALRHTVGNCLTCFSCSRMQTDDVADQSGVTKNTQNATNPNNDGPPDKLPFDRVAMSKKIKSAIEEMHSLSDRVSELLKIIPHHSSDTALVNLKRPVIGSTAAQDTLYGRRDLFEKTIINIITSGKNSSQTLSVLPIVGPGGIGKTTFTQHLYNDERTQKHFDVRVWVCVSSDFDVLRLTKNIHDCVRAIEKDESRISYQTTDLDQLQLYIGQKLKSKRFLIVFDDIWECNSEGWENLLAPFMKGEAKGNMVLVTTRFPSKAEMVKTTKPIPLKGLETEEFFTFFEALIFGGNRPEYYQEDLAAIAKDIANKLKGSPLAAKTVSQILKKDQSQEHWLGVLKNNKWQKQENVDDIMTSLRISYDYLPFHLKKCFPYFSLFPEDYSFDNLEITYFWIGIGIIEKDENYMEELVDNGFLVKEVNFQGDQYYTLHDLLHDLSRSISSKECVNISSVCFRADSIPKSVRHLSITMEDKYDGNFLGEMIKLRSKIDIVNLRALMIFRKYGETIDEILKDTFKEIEGLRVLYIEVKSLESLPYNFSKLIHLRCLKITPSRVRSEVTLPSTLSRFYHLVFLDLRDWRASAKLPKDISRLIKLHHLLTEDELHSSVSEVGNMKCLKELKKFHVKKESIGFELSQLGKLTELGGELNIYNLEKVATKEEAMEAKLVSKGDLKNLKLHWGDEQYRFTFSNALDGTTGLPDILDGLEPHPNLQSLAIKNQDGSAGPRWLCGDITLVMLKSLHLEGVSWVRPPPFGQLLHLESLKLKHVSGLGGIRPGICGITNKSFIHLKDIALENLPEFTEWVGAPNAQSFSRLEKIICRFCPNLCALSFMHDHPAGSCTSMLTLQISYCPKLFLPAMPHTSTVTHIDMPASPSGSAGAFQAGSKIPWVQAQLPKLTSLRELTIRGEPSFMSMALLSNLASLTCLELVDCKNLTVDGFNPLITAVRLKKFKVYNWEDGPRSVAANLISELVVASSAKLLSPSAGCFQLEYLEVDSIAAVLAAPVCSLLATSLQALRFSYDEREESFTEEEENALQLLTSLRLVSFHNCPGLPSLPQGLQSLSSLNILSVARCPQIQSLPNWKGLPTSLFHLMVINCPEIRNLPTEGIPAYLRFLDVIECSPELNEQAKKLQTTCSDRLHVRLNF
uniref:Uncharacterized protein n=1 Tax=Avena sativa TaxID=4498 RepID=A0ACD5UK95_AVESA